MRMVVCLNWTLPAGATACWRGSRVRDGMALVKKSHKNFCFGTDSVWLGSAELAITEVFSSSTLINSLLRGICKKPRCYHISYKLFYPSDLISKSQVIKLDFSRLKGNQHFCFLSMNVPLLPSSALHLSKKKLFTQEGEGGLRIQGLKEEEKGLSP